MQDIPDITSTIFLGVISGILTSAVLFVLLRMFNKVFIPWYQNMLYKGIELSGKWFCADHTMSQEITFDLTQKAETINGIATLLNRDGTNHNFEDIRTFIVTGCVQDRFVYLVLRHEDSSRLGILTYLLQPVGDGRRMEGAMSFYSVRNCRIDCGLQTLWREKAQADAYEKKLATIQPKPVAK